MIDKCESIWKEAVVAESRHCPGFSLQGLRKTTRNIRLTRVAAKTRTQHLPNISLERQCYANPDGNIFVNYTTN
jgi:hypothetical protein